jgi:hypothetical protein
MVVKDCLYFKLRPSSSEKRQLAPSCPSVPMSFRRFTCLICPHIHVYRVQFNPVLKTMVIPLFLQKQEDCDKNV